MHHPVAAAILLVIPCVANAQIYKCTGKDGRVQFSQTKPADANCQESATKAPPLNGGNVDSLMKYSKEIDRSREKEAGAQQKAEQQQARKDARCNAARSRLALLQQVSRVFTVDEKGERHYQDDVERQQTQNNAQQAVALECG